jgi:hypothetical protein
MISSEGVFNGIEGTKLGGFKRSPSLTEGLRLNAEVDSAWLEELMLKIGRRRTAVRPLQN